MSWILFDQKIRYLLHYLDDFLLVGPPGSPEASIARDRAMAVFEQLGTLVATHKTEGPSAQVTFLGFLIDTQAFQLRLPDEKLERLRELIQTWQGTRSCTRREMESLLGHLSHTATAIRPGHLFLRQLFALLPIAPKPHHHIRLKWSVRADLCCWAFFYVSGMECHCSLPEPRWCTSIRMPLGCMAVVQSLPSLAGSVCGGHSIG